MASVAQTQVHQRTALGAAGTSFKYIIAPKSFLAKLPQKLSDLIKSLKIGSTPPIVGFNSLPGEIRNQIWHLVLEAEQHDRFIIVDTCIRKIMPLQITAVSPLLSLNRETRSLALEAYPETIAIKKIDRWELHDHIITATPRSGSIPASYGPDCGVFRYNLERDKFICGMRYAELDDSEKLKWQNYMRELKQEYKIRAEICQKRRVKLDPKYRESMESTIRANVPLYYRYTSARLPQHNTRDLPQAQNVIGMQMWWITPLDPEPEEDLDSVQDGDDDQDSQDQDEEEEEEEVEDDEDDEEEEAVELWDPAEDTIGPWINQEYYTRNFFPAINRELNALFPGRCTCGRDFDPDFHGYCYCHCIHIAIIQDEIQTWFSGLNEGGMPWFRKVARELQGQM
ncbi:hypothetical protein F5X99DRAFT_431946 [Biscogniauxia marginata]|nr:hypothetical protein F5X99DRAFT_431946 [Biscogniauxia marginata]